MWPQIYLVWPVRKMTLPVRILQLNAAHHSEIILEEDDGIEVGPEGA